MQRKQATPLKEPDRHRGGTRQSHDDKMKGRDEEICDVVWVGKRILEWVYVLSKEISLVHHKEVSEVKKKPREFDVVRCVQRGVWAYNAISDEADPCRGITAREVECRWEGEV